jgi:hypothetical protein
LAKAEPAGKIRKANGLRHLSGSGILGTLPGQDGLHQIGSLLTMRAARPIAISGAVVTFFLIAMAPPQCALGGEISQGAQGRFVVAQTSMGAPDPMPPQQTAPSAPSAPSYIPPGVAPRQLAPSQPEPSLASELSWGAIGFTADGSYSSTWKMASKAEAEARVAMKCAEYGRGGCKVVSFSGQECVALATFIGSYKRRRWNLSFSAPGMTYPEAQSAAMARCNSDERSQGRCQPRTTACADGR